VQPSDPDEKLGGREATVIVSSFRLGTRQKVLGDVTWRPRFGRRQRGQVREGWDARVTATSSDGCLILTIEDDGVGGAQPSVGATQNHAKIPVVETMTEEEKISLHHPRRHLDRYKRLYICMTETVDIVPVMTKLSCFGIPRTTAPWILAMRGRSSNCNSL
jgi:hypothetical protein